jgi:hypothetical protein
MLAPAASKGYRNDPSGDIDLFKSLVVASIEPSSSGKGSFIRILGYEKGAKGLINLETSQEVAEVEEHHPPTNREFLDEEMVLYVADNHIIACGLSGRDNTIGNMIAHLGSKAAVIDPSLKFRLSTITILGL